MANKDLIYVRNARPNKVVFHFDGTRYPLEHRGHRGDSTALPAEAAQDSLISRWIQQGQLEKISKEAFMQLGARTIDVLPNEYLAQPMRAGRGAGAGVVPMVNAESDTSKGLSQVRDADVFKQVREGVSPKWGGDLMSTEEEIESDEFTNAQDRAKTNYPSKNRDDTRQAGY